MPRVRLLLPLSLAGVAILGALPGQASAYLTAVSLTTGNPSQVARFVPSNPRTPLLYPIEFPAGATDTQLVGLGYRPQTEDLYAMGSGGTLYVLRGELPQMSFRAIQVNPTPGLSPIQGTSWGFAFKPTRDAIGLVDDAGQNLLFDYLNGSLLSSDGTLAYASGDVNVAVAPVPAAIAFTNPAVATGKTTMYVIDSATDSLAIQGPAESPEAGAGGALHTVGKLGLDVTPSAGFSFSPDPMDTHENYALLSPAAGGAYQWSETKRRRDRDRRPGPL